MPNHNFFHKTLSTQIQDIPSNVSAIEKTLLDIFCSTGECLIKVGLSNLCNYDQNGIEADSIVFPYKIDLEPTGDIKFKDKVENEAELMEQFYEIDPGTVIFRVRAYSSPQDTTGSILGKKLLISELFFHQF